MNVMFNLIYCRSVVSHSHQKQVGNRNESEQFVVPDFEQILGSEEV